MKMPIPRCACGARGRRDCPALGGVICPACCGSRRGSELSCPAHCPNFPFGTVAYDLWLRVDATWSAKATRYVVEHIGSDALEALAREELIGDPEDEEVFLSAFAAALHRALFLRPDNEGKTLAERWEAEGWRGLNNDERVMTRYRRQSFPTIIEIQRVLDAQGVECTDLFAPEPKPFIIFDRNTAARAVRFDRLLVWLCHYPHFSRLGPEGVTLPRDLSGRVIEAIRLLAQAEAQDPQAADPKEYLKEHFSECCALVAEMSEQRFQEILRSVDLHECTAYYALRRPRAEVEAVLSSKPDFELDDELDAVEEGDPPGTLYYSWLRRGESKEIEKDMPGLLSSDGGADMVGSLGKVKLLPDGLVITTFSLQKFAFAKDMAERYFRGLVSFCRETVVDLAQEMAERRARGGDAGDEEPQPRRHEEPVPLGVQQQVAQSFFTDYYRKFLDAPIPALHGKTPRQAAKDPVMRAELIELMKLHLQNMEQSNREKGLRIDISWVVDELGLTELAERSPRPRVSCQ